MLWRQKGGQSVVFYFQLDTEWQRPYLYASTHCFFRMGDQSYENLRNHQEESEGF